MLKSPTPSRRPWEGFGPKQARNVLQALGLTRYEIPIDSGITEWLNNKLRFPFEVSAASLGDKHYYRLVSDAICQLCESCGELPCVLDAAIFASRDRVPWREDQLRYERHRPAPKLRVPNRCPISRGRKIPIKW
jgi:hypothetical protein